MPWQGERDGGFAGGYGDLVALLERGQFGGGFELLVLFNSGFGGGAHGFPGSVGIGVGFIATPFGEFDLGDAGGQEPF